MRIPFLAAVAIVAAVAVSATPDSALAAARWESRQVEVGTGSGDSLLGVACPTASACVAVGSRGAIVTSGDPDGGSGAWRSEAVGAPAYAGTAPGEPDRTSPGTFESISCPTSGMCAAVTFAGDLYVSGDPLGGAATWRASDLDGDDADLHLKSVSCPDPILCVAVAAGAGTVGSGGGEIIAVRDPASPSIALVRAQLDPSLEFEAVSCTGLSLCVAVARKGRIVVSTSPAAAVPGWREIGTPGGPGDLGAVACPEQTTCLVGNARGNVLSSTDANTVTPHWREASTGPSVPITGISCPTSSRCVAVDNNGDVAVSTDPTGPPGSWSAINLIPFAPVGDRGQPFNAFFGVSCPSARFCAAVGSRGTIFTSRNPFEGEVKRGGRQRASQRPRMRILRSDHFTRQSRTKAAGSRVTFRLRPYGRVSGFLCRLDRRRFRPCRSPLRIYARLGPHVLRARAIGTTGLKGPVATAHFAIRRP